MLRHMLARMIFALTLAAAWHTGVQAQGPRIPTAEELANSEEAQRYIAAAMELAGTDLIDEAESYCSPTGPRRTALIRQAAGLPPIEDHLIEPVRVFENLYYIGFNDVGAWAVETSEGIILIDTLNSPAEARDVLVPGLEKIGLDPEQIEYILIGHGHNDHVGGASYLQETYGARIVLSGPDWDLALSGERPDRPRPTRDIVATDGQEVTLGDTTVTLALTPGHTEGTLAMFVPVKHLGQTHTAVFLSGTTMRNRESLETFRHVFDNFGRPLRAETALGGHPGISMNTLELQDQLRQQYPQGPHPLLIGVEPFDRYMSIMLECGNAKLAVVGADGYGGG